MHQATPDTSYWSHHDNCLDMSNSFRVDKYNIVIAIEVYKNSGKQ